MCIYIYTYIHTHIHTLNPKHQPSPFTDATTTKRLFIPSTPKQALSPKATGAAG